MVTEKTQWHHAAPGGKIFSNEVHIWRLLLDSTDPRFNKLKKILSSDELARAGKFHFVKDHNRFVMARGTLRMILAGYLGIQPHELRFECTSFGKPFIAENNCCDPISFSISHSANMVLFAITQNGNIGIDVERIKDTIDVVQVANSFFSAREINALKSCCKNNQAEIFFQYWTRKEALVKAIGKGVSFPLEQCDVSSINGKKLSLVKLIEPGIENSSWYAQDLFPGQGYVAAIAIGKNEVNISYLDYQC